MISREIVWGVSIEDYLPLLARIHKNAPAGFCLCGGVVWLWIQMFGKEIGNGIVASNPVFVFKYIMTLVLKDK